MAPLLAEAQAPVADFSASPTTGCAPLTVSFTDKSSGNPKFYNWDLGDGLSSVQNPVHTYGPGTYTVTLVVRNADGINSITKTNLIVVSPSPTVSFSADKYIACLPANIQFSDNSIANSGSIVKWEWDFGDGGTSASKNPQHTYTKVGYYTLYLKVTNSNGCSNANSVPRFIRTVSGVKADFNTVGPATCKPPFNINFQNLTSGPGTLSYQWDLATTTSTQTSPSNSYPAAGNYTIKLTAQSEYGCSDAITKNVTISGISTSFSGPDSICLGSPASFQSTSVPAPVKAVWNFGDGTGSSVLNPPPKTYSSPGTYPVKLVSTFTGCKDSVTKNITVYGKPAVDFYSANGTNCKAPYTVNFQNLSPSFASATWDWGDGTAPTTSSAVNVSHTYTKTGAFTVTLTITDSKGCSNTISRTEYVHILPPVAGIGGVPAGVCVGQPFKPISTSGAYDAITGYAWDFGDGSPIDNSSSPSHAYAAAGVYPVKLTITTSGGCTASVTVPNAVQVGNKPVIDFKADTSLACRSSFIQFTNLSTPANSAASWDFGDGDTSTLFTPPPHRFADTGLHSVKLKITTNGCTDSLIKANIVHSLPPLARMGFTVDCSNKKFVTFSDSSATDPGYGPVTFLWNFGDAGNTSSTAQNPTMSYPVAPANYTVRLVVNNGLCSDTVYKTIKLIDEKADIGFSRNPPVYCRGERYDISFLNNAANVKQFEWFVAGKPPEILGNAYASSSATTGTFPARLVITDLNGCLDTSAIKTFTITGPTAKFAPVKGGCKNGIITFNDQSVSTGTLTKWVYDFGDGTGPKTFTAPPFTHQYADTGHYTVKLTVYDNTSNNCSDTYIDSVPLVISKPQVFFTADQTVFCPNTPLQFHDSSTTIGAVNYIWQFGDGSTDVTNNPSPVHSYAGGDSVYTVKLIVTDSVGCTDSLSRTNYISTRTPKPFFSIKDTASFCPPLETKFVFKGKDYESFYWDFGDGNPIPSDSTSHFYNTYGTFTPKLFVVGYGGCIDSATMHVTVTDPVAATKVNFNPKSACNELMVSFNVTVPYASRFQLFFGDGGVDSSSNAAVQHFYNLPGRYAPYVFLSDSTGCQTIVGGQGYVDIYGAVPLFGPDKRKFCDSATVFFSDYSQDGLDVITGKNWDFGDGSSYSGSSTSHHYTQPGLYVPALTVTTAAGCSKTLTDTIRVLATPRPAISSADSVCKGLILDFNGSILNPPDTAIAWKWDFGQGQTSTNQNVSVQFPDSGKYLVKLKAVNSLGCGHDTSKYVTVNPLPSIKVTGDTTIVAGGPGIVMPITYSANSVNWNWTPPTGLSCTNCANPLVNPKFSTVYSVKVTDANGCISNRNVQIIVVCNEKNFFIPNTFSPNNDGTNDRFFPRGTGLDRIQAMRIFNRWGELVFEKRNFPANDASSGWDGTYKGKPGASDTYIYMIDIICENANIITYKGNVTLIR